MVLWNKTTKVSFRMDGSRSMVVDNNDDHLNVKATSIDDFVSTQNLTKIDFIKLDVEGAEPNVLKGGIESIKLFRPALAVSIYHHLKHYFEIPLYLNEQLTDYQYNIDYYNPYCIDTILYAVPIEKL